jgi:hypothetical protein
LREMIDGRVRETVAKRPWRCGAVRGAAACGMLGRTWAHRGVRAGRGPRVVGGHDARQPVTSGASTATYAYVPNSPLVGSVTFKQSGTTRLTTTKTHGLLF